MAVFFNVIECFEALTFSWEAKAKGFPAPKKDDL